MKTQFELENKRLIRVNDYVIMKNLEPLAEEYELQDKLWEMEYIDKKLIEVDDGFPIDFN